MKLYGMFLLLSISMSGQVIHITPQNQSAVHRFSQPVPLQGNRKNKDDISANGFSSLFEVQIGVFSYSGTHFNGQAGYEFDWVTSPGGAPYTGPLSFQNVIVYVNGTALGSGPLDTNFGSGLLYTAGPGSGSPLDNCQKTCIDIALQLIFETKPYTFTLLDGKSFTTYQISNTFITPFPGARKIRSICDQNDFCKGQTVPVIAHSLD